MKIFGERNTGTNALTQLIARNSVSEILPATASELNPLAAGIANSRFMPSTVITERIIDSVFVRRGPLFAWKHCATNFGDAGPFQDVFVLFLLRHPASWIVSLFNHPYHRFGPPPHDIQELLDCQWQTVRRERLASAKLRPLQLLEAKARSYPAFASKLAEREIPNHFVRFEDLILCQRDVYRSIAPQLIDAGVEFSELQASTKDDSKSLRDYRDFYGNERWRSALTGLEDVVNSQIDWGLFKRFGYAPL